MSKQIPTDINGRLIVLGQPAKVLCAGSPNNGRVGTVLGNDSSLYCVGGIGWSTWCRACEVEMLPAPVNAEASK